MLRAYESRMTPSLIWLRNAILDGSYDIVRERARDVYGYALLCQTLERGTGVRSHSGDVRLTEREIAVLRATAAGRTTKAMAEEFQISVRTVQWHRNNILKKFGVNTTIAAIAKGRDLHIIP